MAPGPGRGRPGHRVPLAARALGRGPRPDHAAGSRRSSNGQMATVIRWIAEVPETARSGRRNAQPLLASRREPRVRRPAPRTSCVRVRGRSGSHAGRAGLRPDLPRHLAQFRIQSRDHGAAGPAALELLRPPRRPARAGRHRTWATPGRSRPWSSAPGGRAHFLAGRLDEARAWIQDGPWRRRRRVLGLEDRHPRLPALVEAWSGHLERAQALADEALGCRPGGRHPGPSGHRRGLSGHQPGALQRGQPRGAALALR